MYILVIHMSTQTQSKTQVEPKPRPGWVNIMIRMDTKEELDKIKEKHGLPSINEAIRLLIEKYYKGQTQ